MEYIDEGLLPFEYFIILGGSLVEFRVDFVGDIFYESLDVLEEHDEVALVIAEVVDDLRELLEHFLITRR